MQFSSMPLTAQSLFIGYGDITIREFLCCYYFSSLINCIKNCMTGEYIKTSDMNREEVEGISTFMFVVMTLPNIFSIFLWNGIYNFNQKSIIDEKIQLKSNMETFQTNGVDKVLSPEIKTEDVCEYENEMKWTRFFCSIHPSYISTSTIPKNEEELFLIREEILNTNDIEIDIQVNQDLSCDQVEDVALIIKNEEKTIDTYVDNVLETVESNK